MGSPIWAKPTPANFPPFTPWSTCTCIWRQKGCFLIFPEIRAIPISLLAFRRSQVLGGEKIWDFEGEIVVRLRCCLLRLWEILVGFWSVSLNRINWVRYTILFSFGANLRNFFFLWYLECFDFDFDFFLTSESRLPLDNRMFGSGAWFLLLFDTVIFFVLWSASFFGIFYYWFAIGLIFVADQCDYVLIADRLADRTTGGQNERQYCELSANLSRKCASTSRLDGGNKVCFTSFLYLYICIYLFCGRFCYMLVMLPFEFLCL